jgi:hypothetical protein
VLEDETSLDGTATSEPDADASLSEYDNSVQFFFEK